MTFISYAQNFEDVLLWRALSDVAAGFYIDVGAWHPDIDSVTRAFYDRGWCGINVEPVEEYCRRLRAARPRDVTLQIAAGAAEAETDFFVIDGTGLSTLEESARKQAGSAGHAARSLRVRVRRLADICREHAPAEIHFLKVDAEGSERAVLAGADFTAFRPWIVLVEATAPLSTVETHAAWEMLLLDAEYRFVWFDGLNRFYVAAERHAELARHFHAPPNVLDDFLRAADLQWSQRVAASEAEAAELRRQLGEVRSHDDLMRRLADMRGQEVVAVRATLALRDTRLAEETARAEALRHSAQSAEAWLGAMRASTSWRLTAPLRRAVSLLGRGDARPPAVVSGQRSAAKEPDAGPAPVPVTPVPHPTTGRRPLTVVHQFHSGSAVGDAITNAMLLTRAMLRAHGFVSEIFVAHPDPALTHELHPIEELPQHADYVLIVRHSMGFDAFDRIAASPAPKVLHYHNITPPELLEGALRRYAMLGRQQLGQWRDLVVAALADSEYNAAELRTLGFDPVRACTLLFDLNVLTDRAAAAAAKAADAPFTILFVGRVTAAKGQRELLAAYAQFRRRFATPSRLVLIGRHDDAPYVAELFRDIAAHALHDDVVLTGLIPDAARDAWYGAADLYVSLSAHEGFGVPLVEAMAHGVPVLAWPGGAVPYTLGGAAATLASRAPAAAAQAMLAIAADPTRRATIATNQRAVLDRFSTARQMPILLTALARAGAVPPDDAATRALLAANLRFTVTGHVRGSYSLARVNRAVAAALEAASPGRVRLLAVTGESDEAPPPSPASGPHVVISQHYPVLVPEQSGDVPLAYFFWEESLIPAETVAQLNRNFRAVLAPSAFVAKALLDSGVALPVRVIGHAPDLAAFAPRTASRRRGAFTFLHVSSCFPRKGVDALLAAFVQTFRRGDNVRLVIKGFPNPHNDVAEQVARLHAADPDAPDIALIDREMTEAELADLFAAADVLVLPTRGEGFNLPAAEAMATGLPLIVTGYGGHMDFCDTSTARLIAYRLAPSGSHLAPPHSLWAEPDAADLAAALREAVDPARQAEAAQRTERAARRIAGLGADAAARISATALDVLLAPPGQELRLGVVSTWGVRCGVAEYTRHLLAALPPIGPLTVFADRRTGADTGRAVVPAWDVGAADSVPDLARAVAAADPEVLLVQHQPGLLPWAALAALLTAPALTGRTVAATLHNTGHLLHVSASERAGAVAALRGIARVLVHTLTDLERLRGLGIAANATLLPHGAPPPRPGRPARALPHDAAPLIGCYGFFLPGKGIPQLIAALARLRMTWPAARLRLVNAAYGDADSDAEIAACHAAAGTAGLGGAVEWETGFLPHDRSLDLLGDCDVVALPYQESKEASSAALRTALSAGVPVLVTPLPLFDEADGATSRCGGCDTAAIAAELAALLADTARRESVREAGRAWLAARAWKVVATRLGGMLRGLHASRSAT